ncbi:MAG: FtsX-like permease family protein [Acidobacteria bacterium]|nr:FtsX-like permease family protein [Acidobacteriota bacterium]
MGAAIFLLLLVCANVASLQLARTTARGSEIAVRVALGSSRLRLIRQLLVESLCLSLVGALLGSVLAVWGSGLLRQQLGHPSIRFFFYGADGIGVDGGVLIFATFAATAAAIVSGLAPALHGSRADLSDVLKPGTRGGGAGGGNRLRNTFVVIEIVLAVVLLAGAAYMSRSVGSLVAFQRGLDTETSLLAVRLRGEAFAEPEQRAAFARTTLEAITAMPGMTAVGLSSSTPGVLGSRPAEFEIDGREPANSAPLAERHHVSAGYFDALGVRIIAGRAPHQAEVEDGAHVVVVSSALADRYWPNDDAIGGRLRFQDESWLTIVGVAADVSRAWNDSAPARAIYRPYTHSAPTSLVFAIATANPDAVLPAARARIWEAEPRLPIESHRTVADAIAERSMLYRPVMSMASMFATAAFLLALAGIYSVTSYAATQRTWEIGVRMALGANSADVVRLFVSQAVRLVLVGLALGLPAAWMLTRALAAFGRGMTTDVDATVVLAALSTAVVLAAALASYLPARGAGKTDPATTLRSE